MATRQLTREQATLRDVTENGVVTVAIDGELDVTVVPALCGYLAQLARRRPRVIVFELSGVTFMDCAAARAITRAGRTLPGHPRPTLHHPRAIVRRVLSVTGLDARCARSP